MRFLFLSFLALLALLISIADVTAGKLYKWTDADGKVHYSDKPPPEASTQERKVLNEQGLVTDTIARQKTPEEIAAAEAAAAEVARLQAIEDDKKQRDQMLLSTYTSVDELEFARDGRILALDAQVRVVSGTISTLEERIANLERQSQQIKAAGNPVPKPVQKQITEAREELLQNQRFLISRQTEQDEIRQKYEGEIARFKELKGIKD